MSTHRGPRPNPGVGKAARYSRKLRRQLGLTQRELAAMAGVSYRLVTNFEGGLTHGAKGKPAAFVAWLRAQRAEQKAAARA